MTAHDHRRLQRAVDTINLYGGLMGAAEVAETLGVQVPNLSWTGIEPTWRVSNGRIPVYLAADVQHEMTKRNRRSGASE